MKKIESFRIQFRRNIDTVNGLHHGWVIQQKVWYGWRCVDGISYGDIKNAQKNLDDIRDSFAQIGVPTVQAN